MGRAGGSLWRPRWPSRGTCARREVQDTWVQWLEFVRTSGGCFSRVPGQFSKCPLAGVGGTQSAPHPCKHRKSGSLRGSLAPPLVPSPGEDFYAVLVLFPLCDVTSIAHPAMFGMFGACWEPFSSFRKGSIPWEIAKGLLLQF